MIRVCKSCHQKNRIPAERLADIGRCGKCRAPLDPADEPVDVGPDEFRDIIQGAKVPVLVDFWAEWCGPCRMAAPEVKRVAKEMAGRAVVLKVNTEHHPELASAYGVRGIPNFAVLKGGDLVLQQPGLVDHRRMRQWLEQAGA